MPQVLSSRELGLLGRVVSEGKGVVIAANKMDLVPGATARRMYLSTLRKSLVGGSVGG
jgi:predicted GTPase